MKNELDTGAKHLNQEAQYALRKSVIRLYKKGKKVPEIIEILGVSRAYVYGTIKKYNEEGIVAIKPHKRGRRTGEKRVLTPIQEKEIVAVIVDKNPEQLKLPGCMWTRKNICQLILRKYKIDIKASTLGYYLSRWGFSVQRPVKRAYKQDAEKIDKWLNEEFPGITKRAETEKAEIFFGDETGIQNTANYAKGYAPKGKTPVIYVESKKMKINMLSAISKRGKLRFMLYKDNMTSNKLIDFMGRLIKDTGKKVFLVLDNLRAHHSQKVKIWLSSRKDKIELFYLPPYAPEYNPDELVNSELKRNLGNSSMPKSEKELEHKTRSYLKKLQLDKKKISSFFQAEFTAYAA